MKDNKSYYIVGTEAKQNVPYLNLKIIKETNVIILVIIK